MPELGAEIIHVWQVDLDRNSLAARLYTCLTEEERDRAGRFRFAEDRDLFVTARGMMRTLCSYYQQTPAREVVFVTNAHGKPELDPARNSIGLQVNVTHSGRIVLCALSIGEPVGVDVEVYRPAPYEDLAERVFSPEERADLKQATEDRKPSVFFTFWTRKEALVKAAGTGLTVSLDAFSVIGTTPSTVLLEDRIWSYQDLSVPEGYAAAVASGYQRFICKSWDYDVCKAVTLVGDG